MYKKHSPELHCTDARYALTRGAGLTATKYKLTESTVRRFVKSFKEAQSKNRKTDLEIVPKRKREHPTLLPEEIDHKVMVMVKKVQQSGPSLTIVLSSPLQLESSWLMTGS